MRRVLLVLSVVLVPCVLFLAACDDDEAAEVVDELLDDSDVQAEPEMVTIYWCNRGILRSREITMAEYNLHPDWHNTAPPDCTPPPVVDIDTDGDGLLDQYDGCNDANAPAGLVAYWAFEGGSNANVAVDSFDGRHGTIYGAGRVGGKIGKAMSFNGTSDYIDTGYILDNYADHSASLWIYIPSGSTGGFVFGAYPIASTFSWWSMNVDMPNNRIEFLVWGGGGSRATFGIDASYRDKWLHIVTISDFAAKNLQIYVNGVKGTDGFSEGTVQNTTHSQFIGADNRLGNPLIFFKGSVDEMAIFNRKLTAGEIAYLYNGGAGQRY